MPRLVEQWERLGYTNLSGATATAEIQGGYYPVTDVYVVSTRKYDRGEFTVTLSPGDIITTVSAYAPSDEEVLYVLWAVTGLNAYANVANYTLTITNGNDPTQLYLALWTIKYSGPTDCALLLSVCDDALHGDAMFLFPPGDSSGRPAVAGAEFTASVPTSTAGPTAIASPPSAASRAPGGPTFTVGQPGTTTGQ